MKKIVFIVFSFFYIVSAYCKHTIEEIYDKSFRIKDLYISKCINFDGYGYPVDTTTLKEIFNFSSDEIGEETFDYNEDNDTKSNLRKEPVEADVIGVYEYSGYKCFIVSMFIDLSPIMDYKEYICTFSKNGIFIDCLLAYHKELSFYINRQYVIIDRNKIKIFEYKFNEDKYDKEKNKYKDNDEPIEYAFEKNYEITNEGKFRQIGDTTTYSLKHRGYYNCDHKDDPMLKYIK